MQHRNLQITLEDHILTGLFAHKRQWIVDTSWRFSTRAFNRNFAIPLKFQLTTPSSGISWERMRVKSKILTNFLISTSYVSYAVFQIPFKWVMETLCHYEYVSLSPVRHFQNMNHWTSLQPSYINIHIVQPTLTSNLHVSYTNQVTKNYDSQFVQICGQNPTSFRDRYRPKFMKILHLLKYPKLWRR